MPRNGQNDGRVIKDERAQSRQDDRDSQGQSTAKETIAEWRAAQDESALVAAFGAPPTDAPPAKQKDTQDPPAPHSAKPDEKAYDDIEFGGKGLASSGQRTQHEKQESENGGNTKEAPTAQDDMLSLAIDRAAEQGAQDYTSGQGSREIFISGLNARIEEDGSEPDAVWDPSGFLGTGG